MWKISDIRNDKRYYLALVQLKSGSRIFILQEEGVEPHISEAILATMVVPNELLIKQNMQRISEMVPLKNGERFYVDAHNIWLTNEEVTAMMAEKEDDEIPWLNGMAPRLPPK